VSHRAVSVGPAEAQPLCAFASLRSSLVIIERQKLFEQKGCDAIGPAPLLASVIRLWSKALSLCVNPNPKSTQHCRRAEAQSGGETSLFYPDGAVGTPTPYLPLVFY
jgi:hypothetical protein